MLFIQCTHLRSYNKRVKFDSLSGLYSQSNRLCTRAFGFTLISFAFLLLSGCLAGDDNNARHIEKVAAKPDSSSRQVSVKRDTATKQRYVAAQISEEAMQKAVIHSHDSSFHVFNNIRADYRIIGYESPDTNSRKMVLFSIFTSDVKDNPFRCLYGAYYDSAQGDKLVIKYTGERGSFIETKISGKSMKPATAYFEKKWTEFDE